MAYNRVGIEQLRAFLPTGAYEWIIPYLSKYSIDLKITPERKSKLGDYIYSSKERRHKISINGTLNKYEFFFTFIHELAHLTTFSQYKNTVEAHGKEWKSHFKCLLDSAIDLFPNELKNAIIQHLNSTKSSQCFDAALYLALKSFDEIERLYVKDLKEGQIFSTPKGEKFQLIHKRRTRYLCENISTKKQYLFPQLYEVTIED